MELEAEQKRLVTAFGKGYLSEADLDAHMERIRRELQRLPLASRHDDIEAFIEVAASAGETLADMAGYWREALPEERRDIVWTILLVEGLIYDLERRTIAGLLPRPDMLPVLALGLETQLEQRDGGLWRRDIASMPKLARVKRAPPPTPPALTPEQRSDALALLQSGLSLRKVAAKFPGVSYGAIWRLTQSKANQNEVDVSEG